VYQHVQRLRKYVVDVVVKREFRIQITSRSLIESVRDIY